MWNYIEEMEFLKKSEKYQGLEISFTVEISGSYKEEVLPPICSNPSREDYYDPGEDEVFIISDVRILEAIIYSYPEEENKEIDYLIEEIELETDKDRQQGLIEKLCIETDIGSWENLQLTDKEEDELKQEILRRIYVY